MIQLNLSSGETLPLQSSPGRKFRGQRIPGSSLFKAERTGFTVFIHQFIHPLYAITLRQFSFLEQNRVITTERNDWLRLEMVLSGSLSILPKDGTKTTLLTGQYQLTSLPLFASDYAPGQSVLYFTAHFSPELLAGIGADQSFAPAASRPVPHDLLNMIYDILKCPFREGIRNFYYANRVRELLFSHLASIPVVLPGELNARQVAAMYEADRIMAGNLDGRITIPELARMLGTNFVTLKRNYEKVFGIGIFPRMMQRKMEHIQLLLEKTNKPLKEIGDLAGYQTLPGFINAFRKRFKITPKEWRKERRGF